MAYKKPEKTVADVVKEVCKIPYNWRVHNPITYVTLASTQPYSDRLSPDLVDRFSQFLFVNTFKGEKPHQKRFRFTQVMR